MENKYGRIAPSAGVPTDKIKFEPPVDIAHNVTVYAGSEIGKYTYINVGSVIYGGVSLGRYCSVGRSVEIGAAHHPVDYLSTHPFQVARSLFMKDPDYASVERKAWRFHRKTHIGHDVWIGAKACIMSGVTIGSGAVIGAGAVVTKDVEPYSIIGGVPAKLIKKRFPDEVIAELLEVEWWDIPMSKISKLPFDEGS